MNLFTDQQKSLYSAPIQDLHDSFARDIVVFKTSTATLISSTENYNFLYGQQTQATVQYTPVSGVFKARIKWFDGKDDDNYKDMRPVIPGNYCRIKVKADALNFIKDSRAERIEVDGRTVSWVGNSEPHGLFNIDFYNIYLKEEF